MTFFKPQTFFANGAIVSLFLLSTPAQTAEIFFASGATGNAIEQFKSLVQPWEQSTGNTVTYVSMPASSTNQFGQYRLWLAAGVDDIDVYQTDVVWAPQLAEHFLDLSTAAVDVAGDHFPSIIQSQTVQSRLVAMPLYTDAPALYYRKDLLAKYSVAVPQTWDDLETTALTIQSGEREAGNPDFWGYVWQGNAYEGLTCNALEWVKSFGGGQIVEADGTISINNPQAVVALETIADWVGTISPEGVLAYKEEESRGVWQIGNAAFMRNWPYAYHLGNGDDSPVKDLFGVATLPVGKIGNAPAATLGGWNVAVSKYSDNPQAAISLALYLASAEVQKRRAIEESRLPTIISLYDDGEIARAQPIVPQWKAVFLNAVPRPSAPTLGQYNEVSAKFWSAVHRTLSGEGSAAENLELLEADLRDIKGEAWR